MKIKSLILLLFILSGTLYADYLADNNHRIYRYLTIWQDKGYIKQLPPVRPYPLQLLKKLLAEVKEKGSPDDVEIAERYYNLITTPGADILTIKGKNLPAPIYYSAIAGLITDIKDMYWYGGGKIDTAGLVFNDIVSYTGKLSIAAQNNLGQGFFPQNSRTLFVDDYNSGGAGVGAVDIGHLGEGGFFIGTDRFYFSAGFWRSTYGPFFENGPVIGPQAPGAGHFALAYRGDWITVNSVFLSLIAKQYAQKSGTPGLPYQLNTYASENIMKYLIVHTIEAHIADWLDLGLMQSVIGGGALHPEFLIPIQYVFYTQEQAGGYNNSQMGVYFKLRLPANIGIDFIAFIDDWNLFSKVNGSGLNLNNAQNKYAIQAGISWTPDSAVFKRLSFDYQIISQYMYTHVGQVAAPAAQVPTPYLNYTHNGTNLGSAMEPNSDRFSLKAYVMPASWLDIDIFATFMRHGNASADVYNTVGNTGIIGDGTVWDDGWTNNGVVTFYTPARTLNQAVMEYTLQAGLELSFNFPFKYVELSFKIGYIFQQIWNKSLTIASGTATATAMGPQSGLNQTSNFLYVSTEVKF